jgi:methyl-accepting chemotaxis protein
MVGHIKDRRDDSVFPKSYRGKLLLLGVLIGLMVLLDAVLIFQVILSNKQVKTVSYPTVALANEMNQSIIQVQQYLSDISATRAQDGKDDGFKNAEENAKSFQEALEKFAVLRPDKAEFLKEYENAFAEYYKLGKKMAQAYIDGGPAAGNKLMPDFDKEAERLSDLTEQLRSESEQEMSANLEKVDRQVKIVLAIIVASGLFTVILTVVILRVMTRALGTLISGIQKDEHGYITVKAVELHTADEFGNLANVLNTLLYQVKGFVEQVSGSAQLLTTSAADLSSSVEQSAQAANQVVGAGVQVAQGAEKQLHLVKDANAVVRQIAMAIHQVADNTELVTAVAEKTALSANDGEQMLQQAVHQMNIIEGKTSETVKVVGELEEKSQQIGQIVEVISGISGQTNLLALNAAIESARAGESGRGFAVVAEEVRKLAEQSQEAAKQITLLINDVQIKIKEAAVFMNEGKKEVDTGAQVVAAAGQNFGEILTMVNDMTKQVREILPAIQEVTGGTQNVVNAVEAIDQESKNTAVQSQNISAVMEEQSTSVEEIASASRELANMAETLQEAIRAFKV